jgi:hypothetical protein
MFTDENRTRDRGKKNSLNLEETVRASRPNIEYQAAIELGQRLTLLGAAGASFAAPSGG